ncbi:MAG: hypothetical protein LC742_00040 [Acidobacteria bacterium]|nr:hypothetical protein [Acidobacteriota bacterium]
MSRRKRINTEQIERFEEILADGFAITVEELKRRGFDLVTIDGQEGIQLGEQAYLLPRINREPEGGYIN